MNPTLYNVCLFVFACPDCEAPIGTVMHVKAPNVVAQAIPLECLFCPWTGRLRLEQAVYRHNVRYQDGKCSQPHTQST
jgi:hypothetical protein